MTRSLGSEQLPWWPTITTVVELGKMYKKQEIWGSGDRQLPIPSSSSHDSGEAVHFFSGPPDRMVKSDLSGVVRTEVAYSLVMRLSGCLVCLSGEFKVSKRLSAGSFLGDESGGRYESSSLASGHSLVVSAAL